MDLNHPPLGYEPTEGWNFNNLQDAGGARSHCEERQAIDIGQRMDRRGVRDKSTRRKLGEWLIAPELHPVLGCRWQEREHRIDGPLFVPLLCRDARTRIRVIQCE